MGRFKGGAPEKGKYLPVAPVQVRPDTLQHPTFCLRHVVRPRDFSFDDRTAAEKAAVADTMYAIGKLTWAQIRGAHRHGLGGEKIEQNQLKFQLPAHITKDVTILAFRFLGKAPMLGYREGTTLHIICLDPNFRAYDH